MKLDKRPKKYSYAHMASVYRALKKYAPDEGDIPIHRKTIKGKVRFVFWL